MTAHEQSIYCNSSYNAPNNPPLLNQNMTFKYDFYIKSYTSGSYFYNTVTGKWSNEGTTIFSDTNLMLTHCQTMHLTQFAGGLIILPNRINFEYDLANASPLKNPIIYSVVIAFTLFYFIFLIWGYRQDKLDEKKMAIILLEDNLFGDNYFYEVTVFTGSRSEAATESKVFF